MNSSIDEQWLVAGLRRGDSDAQAHLLHFYADPLMRFLVGMCGTDPADVEDVAVEAMERAILRIDQFVERPGAGPHLFRNWLFTIARNVSRDQMRRRPESGYVADMKEMAAPDAEDEELVTVPAINAVRAALSTLPSNQHRTLLLHYGGLPLSSVANILGVPPGTVRQWKRRGLTTLTQALQHDPALAYLQDRSGIDGEGS